MHLEYVVLGWTMIASVTALRRGAFQQAFDVTADTQEGDMLSPLPPVC